MGWFRKKSKPTIQMDRHQTLPGFIAEVLCEGALKVRHHEWHGYEVRGVFEGERGFYLEVHHKPMFCEGREAHEVVLEVLRSAHAAYQSHLYREETLDALVNDVTAKRSLEEKAE